MIKKILISLVFILLLISCTTTKYIEKEVPVEVTKTEYVYQLKQDSVYIHDSINVYTKGDTVFKDKIKICYKSIIQKDTIHVTDSIPVIVRTTETKIQEVNKLKWYQKALNTVGLFSLLFLFIYIYIKIKTWKI